MIKITLKISAILLFLTIGVAFAILFTNSANSNELLQMGFSFITSTIAILIATYIIKTLK